MYVRLLVLWGCWLGLLVGSGGPASAQTPGTDTGVAVPNAPGLASPPLPPTAAPPSAPAAAVAKRLTRSRTLKIVADPAHRAAVRHYRLPATVADSLTALRTVRELVLALQGRCLFIGFGR